MPPSEQPPNRFDPKMLDILRCPITRSKLRMENDRLISEVGGLVYDIKDGIPVMLPESAKLPAGISSVEEFKEKFGIN